MRASPPSTRFFTRSTYSPSELASGVLQKGQSWRLSASKGCFPQHAWYFCSDGSIGSGTQQIGHSSLCGDCLKRALSFSSAARFLHSFLWFGHASIACFRSSPSLPQAAHVNDKNCREGSFFLENCTMLRCFLDALLFWCCRTDLLVESHNFSSFSSLSAQILLI